VGVGVVYVVVVVRKLVGRVLVRVMVELEVWSAVSLCFGGALARSGGCDGLP
jgi:hypothetical protein